MPIANMIDCLKMMKEEVGEVEVVVFDGDRVLCYREASEFEKEVSKSGGIYVDIRSSRSGK